MIEAPLALAFGAGMVATFNPCGFAMLPAYLSYFLGLEGEQDDPSGGVFRALAVGAAGTGGFVRVFAVVGMIIEWTALSIQSHLPWLTIAIGIALMALGIAFLAGFNPTVRLPRVQRGGQSREVASMFLFGVSYATASVSCTIGPFLALTSLTFQNNSFASGVATYVAYALGMGLVLTVLTLALALAEGSIVGHMRKAMKYVHRVSGALLVVAGAYTAYYGYYELRLYDGDDIGGPAERVFGWNADLSSWVQDVGTTRIGLVLAGTIAVVVILTIGWRRSQSGAADRHPAETFTR